MKRVVQQDAGFVWSSQQSQNGGWDPSDHGDSHTISEPELRDQLEIPASDKLNDTTALPNISATTHTQTESHPNSGKPIVDTSSQTPTEAWSTFFATREDILISEIILEAALSEELSDKLLKIFELCQTGKGKVTLTKFTQVETAWATWQHTSVESTIMSRK